MGNSSGVGWRLVAPLVLALLLGAAPGAGPAPVSSSIATASAAAPGSARVVDERWIRPGREVDVTIASPALQGRATARLLLPRGWSSGSARRWPVLSLLHGCCERDAHRVWTRNTDVERLAATYGVIVVMPPAGWAGFYSDWAHHGRGGAPRWEDFHLRELRRIVERDYGGGTRRAIAGLSMGGFGALSYTARHPGMFAAAASFSGVVHTLMDVRGPALTSGLVASGGDDPTALWGDPVLDRDVWAAHNPYDLVPRLGSIPLYLSSGDGAPGPLDRGAEAGADLLEATIGAMNRRLLARLRAAGASVTAHLYGPGTHTWRYWRRELHRAFPMLMTAVGARRTTHAIPSTLDPQEPRCVSAAVC